MKYSDKFLDPRWQRKRLEIFERDKWACRSCSNTKETLHVHHLAYLNNTEPWDYKDELFLTLCATCHEFETNERYAVELDLLSMLKHGGFLVNSISELAGGFHQLNLIGNEYLTARIIAFALETPTIMKTLETFYFNNHIEEGKNGETT
jgi:hypothetical protein